MRRQTNLLIGSILLLGSIVLSGQFLAGQEFRSTLSGEVTDPSGAVIPSAAVTAIKNDTQQIYSATTSSVGTYYIPYVLPGVYTVSVKASGFKTAVQDNVTLSAGQPYGLNFKLEVGATSQEVTVTTAPPAIETMSGSGGTLLTDREIENLPLNGRQIYMLIGTTPGSQFLQTTFGATGFSGTRGWDVNNEYTIGGGLQGYQLFTLNGANMTQMTGYGPEGTWMTAPNIDAIQEVNVMTNTYDVRHGHTAGGTMNIVTKSGTNQFHGDAFEYLEAGFLNANNFEDNLSGLPTQNTHQHQYGGTFGGPLKKDKIFFFGSFEGYWENIPFTTVTSVPPAYLRPQSGQGVDFSASGYTVYDPSTTVCTVPGGVIGNCPGNAYARTEFPNDTIPASRIDPTAAALLNFFPLPNINQSSVFNNYVANVPDKYRYYQPMIRVDYNSSDRTRWYAMYEYQWGTEFRNSSGFTGPAENGDIDSHRNNTVASADMTHTFSPTLVGDFKLSFARFTEGFPDGPLSTPSPSSIGLNMPSIPTTTLKLLPEIYFSEIYPQIIGNSVSTDIEQNAVFNGDFTKIHGAHSFVFGGEIGDYFFAEPGSVGHPNGDFTFGTDFTQYNQTMRGELPGITDGNVIADMLLGDPDSGGVDWNHTLAEGFPMYSFYGQDNWRVNHKLTLNLGLRYDVERGVRDRFNGLNRGICTTCINPITNDPAYIANITNAANVAAWTAAGINPATLSTVYGGILFAGTNGQPRDAYNTDYGNLAPRAGFAYALNDKTVIRGGWGWVFAYGIEAGTTEGFSITTPYISSINGITPANYFQSGTPFPSGAEEPIGSSQGLLTGVGDAQYLDFPQRKIPRAQIMSFGVQRELPGGMTLDVHYSGNYARALRQYGPLTSGPFWINGTLPYSDGYYQLQQNHYNPTVASNLLQQVPNPYYGVVPATTSAGSTPTVLAMDLMVPFSEFGSCSYCADLVGDYTDPYGKNWYDGLEVKLNKRLYGASRGMTFQLAYTYSKTMESADYRNGWPFTDPHPIYEPIYYDRTHVFTLAGEWDLPFGKGAKYFATNPPKVLGAFINGWRLNWIFSAESGFPQGLPSGQWYTSTRSYIPTGGPTFSQWIYNCGAAGPLSCWTGTPALAQGNLPDEVSYLRQPTIPNLDLSLHKDFAFTESKKLQIRAEAFNFMNTPLFPGPDTNPYDGPPVQGANGSWSGFGTVPFVEQNFPRMVQLSVKFLF